MNLNDAREPTIDERIIKALDGSDYDNGQVETAQAQADNNSRAIANLLSTLVASQILSAAQVHEHVVEFATYKDSFDESGNFTGKD